MTTVPHPAEPHTGSVAARLNWLRAGVLGANDGIVSTAGIVVGVAAASAERAPILTAGVAGLLAGAVSMALGEYVSVSSQRDTERALIEKERRELAEEPEAELTELVGLYEQQGLSHATATAVATELTERDALKAHLAIELGIDQDDVVSPWHAAMASAVAFFTGALLPMATILLLPHPARIVATFVAVLLALAVTGYLAAWIGGSPRGRAVIRTVIGGAIALAATFLVGSIFGTAAG